MGQALRDIGTLFNLAYSDMLRLSRTMWWVIGLMLVLLFLGALPGALLAMVLRTPLSRELVSSLSSVVGLWLAAPYMVSLYRFIITNTVSRPETLRRSDAARRFFAWSAVMVFIVSVPSYAYALLTPLGATVSTTPGVPPLNVPQTLVTFALLVATWIFTVRVITLLPGAAMDRPVTLREALAQTRGRFWFIVGATLAVVLPCALTAAVLQLLVEAALGAAVAPAVSTVITVLMVLVVVQLGLSLSARLYQKFAPEPVDRLA